MDYQSKLYRINDVLTALAQELGVTWPDEDTEDDALNEASHAVADALNIRDEDAVKDRESLITHLQGGDHGLQDTTLVACLKGATTDNITEWLVELHTDEHANDV